MVSSQNDDDETEPYETDDTPVLTEEEIAQLQEEDVDTEPYTSDHSHFVDIDGTVFVPLGPKVQAAPDKTPACKYSNVNIQIMSMTESTQTS